MTKDPREAAARALCRQAGHPENIKFEGKPMWQSYLDTVDLVLNAIGTPEQAAWAAVSPDNVITYMTRSRHQAEVYVEGTTNTIEPLYRGTFRLRNQAQVDSF